MAHLELSHVIEAPRNDVFDFVADFKNLAEIMSADYRIEPTGPIPKLAKGAEYDIRLTRVGVSVLWGIVIEDLEPNAFIRDRQSHGPFSLWVHTQKLEDHGAGTLLTDIIEYDISFGLIGKLVDDLFIRHDLHKVFARRHGRIAEHFLREQAQVGRNHS
jgi:ligand-binding SRPBCC domain-containing protein